MSSRNEKTVWDIGKLSVCGGAAMSLEPEVRKKLQKQIDELKAQNTVLSSQLKAEIETLKKAIIGYSGIVRSE